MGEVIESETRVIWRLLWLNGIEFKSGNPEHDPKLIWFIRNSITKRFDKDGNFIAYIAYFGMAIQFELK